MSGMISKIPDPRIRLRSYLTVHIGCAQEDMGYPIMHTSEELLCCDYETLFKHIESQFEEGMTWDNQFTDWQVEYPFPLHLAYSIEHLYKLCHYKGLRPVWNRKYISKIQ